ncbi:hypothetical protein CIB48_g6148 [Xylaria polymorpha]|nr:hypothetical protein CIB48_g6148 [Xylaria polymorpha]
MYFWTPVSKIAFKCRLWEVRSSITLTRVTKAGIMGKSLEQQFHPRLQCDHSLDSCGLTPPWTEEKEAVEAPWREITVQCIQILCRRNRTVPLSRYITATGRMLSNIETQLDLYRTPLESTYIREDRQSNISHDEIQRWCRIRNVPMQTALHIVEM